VNITVKARHMDITEAIRKYAESKAGRLDRFYDGVQTAEMILDTEAEHTVVEMVVTGRRKATFVASARNPDMYAAVDQCVGKVAAQLRRHKDRVRDRQGPPHSEVLSAGSSAEPGEAG